jgi:hypothetical protein
MFDKLAHSWDLVKASANILQADKKLLLFPLLSTICTLLVAASFFVPIVVAGGLADAPRDSMPMWFWVTMFVFYVIQYTVIFFFNTALVGTALMRMDGGEPTFADGLRIAMARLPAILGYAVIAATVGMILRMLQERAGFIGRWIVGLLGVAWTVATFLTVPVLVSQNVGPIDAVKRSAELLKRTWGENLAGNIGMGLVFGILIAIVAFGGIALVIAAASADAKVLGFAIMALAVVGVALLALVQTALQGIYAAALYRYATTGDASGGFDHALIADAFHVKA